MIDLTKEQRELRNKIEELNDQIKVAEIEIKAYQKNCNHIWANYPNPDVEVKYCVICGFEEYK